MKKEQMVLQNRTININENLKLFEDYLYNFQKLADFFTWNPLDDWVACAKKRLNDYKPRAKVKEILVQQNKSWNASEKTLEKIEIFGKSNTLAVVTGQQAGIFGGPLYTIYKALTSIKLAHALKRKYPEWEFVPVFWMEVGDNDYREVNHFNLLNLSNQVVRIELPDEPRDLRSIYLRSIPPEIEMLHNRLTKISAASEFSDDIFANIREIFCAGKSFADAFAEWLLYSFGEYGLIVINSADKKFGKIAQPIFEGAAENWQKIHTEFANINQGLVEKGYHNQVTLHPNQTLLFFETEDRARVRVDAAKEGFVLRHADRAILISQDKLKEIFRQYPERFTPNVILRPIVQDLLLPTIAYVAGPGEISYAAQLKPLYQIFSVVEPIFFPRARITIIERKIQKLINKFDLDYEDIFRDREKLTEERIRHQFDHHLTPEFDTARLQVQQVILKLEEILKDIDPTLLNVAEKAGNKIESSLNLLRHKAEQAFERKMETEISQLNKIFINLFPQGNYQERVLNILQYLVKYGPNFIDDLYEVVRIDTPDHQIIFI